MRPLLVALVAVTFVAGCGESEEPAPGADAGQAADAAGSDGSPAGALPPELAKLRAQAGQLLDGGPDAFEARLAELEGHPVVVNKWASWCGPCRAEFPFFRSQAEQREGEVAFLGVNSGDNQADAAAFLEEFPVPYPSYSDPDLEVADVFGGVAAFPTTAYYDEDGELAFLKQGGYATEEQLAEDIERYAG